MAETYVRGRITALNMIEGDTDKGHWARQEAVIAPADGGRPLQFVVNSGGKIQMAGLQVGMTYTVRLYLESREGRNKDGQPMWFNSFVYGGTFPDDYAQYEAETRYLMRDPNFAQKYRMRSQQQYAVTSPYGNQYAAQPQGHANQQYGTPPPPQAQGYCQQPPTANDAMPF